MWTWTDIVKESYKIGPSRIERYSTSAIIFVLGYVWISAAIEHSVPCLMLWFMSTFMVSTRFSIARSEINRSDNRGFSTIATTEPLYVTTTISANRLNCDQSSKT